VLLGQSSNIALNNDGAEGVKKVLEVANCLLWIQLCSSEIMIMLATTTFQGVNN
jgi:hypothetical protein